jgi:HD domain
LCVAQGHAEADCDIVEGVELPRLIAEHHERLDGSGYPQGLKAAAILPEAKILAVADIVEAIDVAPAVPTGPGDRGGAGGNRKGQGPDPRSGGSRSLPRSFPAEQVFFQVRRNTCLQATPRPRSFATTTR